jgi:hypothetical protein
MMLGYGHRVLAAVCMIFREALVRVYGAMKYR